MAELRKRVKEHCGKGVPEKAHLLELGWYIKEVIVTYVQYERYEEKEYHVEENRRQGVIKNKKRWYEYIEKMVHSQKNQKAQQKRVIVERRSGEPLKC